MTAARAATSRGSRRGWPTARWLRSLAAAMHQETVRSRAADDKDDRPCGRHVRLVDGDIHVVAVANLEYCSLGTSFATNRRHGWHMTGCPATNCRTVCLVPRWRCAPCVAARPTAGWAWGCAVLGSAPAAAASCRAGAPRVRMEGRRRRRTFWKSHACTALGRKFGLAAGPSLYYLPLVAHHPLSSREFACSQ